MISIKVDESGEQIEINGNTMDVLTELCGGINFALMEMSRFNESDFNSIKNMFIEVMQVTDYKTLKDIIDRHEKR